MDSHTVDESATCEKWLHKAALYEILAFGLLLPTKELAEAVSSGEFADALQELAGLNGLDPAVVAQAASGLAAYAQSSANIDTLFHELRVEYTHLFVGAPEPVASPFAGIWWAHEADVAPLLFVNKESMAVERYMRSCGIGQPEGTNEPLDHIASELEFLQYLCMVNAKSIEPPESIEMPEDAYEVFFAEHFSEWSKKFAAAVIEKARLPFYRELARVLLLLS